MDGVLDKSSRPARSGRRIVWLFLAAAVVTGLTFAVRSARTPVHQGRTLADWFNEPELGQISLSNGMPGGPGTPPGPAFQAFLDADTHALPSLATVALQRPNWYSRGYFAFHKHLPGVLSKRLPPGRADEYYQRSQVRSLTLIGTIGYWHSRPRSWGNTNAPFPKALIQSTLVRSLSDPDPRVRASAAAAAACMPDQTAPLVPNLIRLMGDNDSAVRFTAINSLGCFGPAASMAVGPLQNYLLNRSSDSERLPTVEALGKIGPAAEPSLPAIVPALASTNVWLQRAAALAIFQIGRTPPEAIEPLSRCTTAPTQVQLRQCAALTLWNTDPADPDLVASVSNAFRASPVLGAFHLRSGHPAASGSNLVPLLQYLANNADAPTRRFVEGALAALQPPAAIPEPRKPQSPYSPEAAL